MRLQEPTTAIVDRNVAGLTTLFALLYFVQGISEPTEGLIAQPTRSLLRNWGYSTESVTTFMALLALPWAIKPVYGLLTDFVPLAGTRRRSWLLITTLATSVGLTGLYFFPPASAMAGPLLIWLLIPTMGVAFSDVVVDALMVEEGQPRGLTGWLQSAQWAAMWSATIIAGFVGGWLSQHKLQPLGYLIAGLVTFGSFLVAVAVVREPRRAVTRDVNSASEQGNGGNLLRVVQHPGLAAVAGFLFLWSFNPFSASVLNEHLIRRMGFSEQFYGLTISLQAVGAMLGSLAYAAYCRRLAIGSLVHLSIVAGVLATVAYWGLVGTWSAAAISVLVGFIYMTGTIIQLDLAARTCEAATAGTTFSFLMALTNLAAAGSTAVGGWVYERLAQAAG